MGYYTDNNNKRFFRELKKGLKRKKLNERDWFNLLYFEGDIITFDKEFRTTLSQDIGYFIKKYYKVDLEVSKNTNHFYLEDESILNFLERSGNILLNTKEHLNQLKDLLETSKIKQIDKLKYSNRDRFIIYKNGDTNLYLSNFQHAYSVNLYTKSKSFYLILIETGCETICYWAGEDNKKVTLDLSYAEKIMKGLLLYIKHFPNLILDEPPIEFKKYKSGHYKLASNDIISNSERQPHFRRGHLRVLKSSRYKKKRFKTIFVKPCFVGENQKTVL